MSNRSFIKYCDGSGSTTGRVDRDEVCGDIMFQSSTEGSSLVELIIGQQKFEGLVHTACHMVFQPRQNKSFHSSGIDFQWQVRISIDAEVQKEAISRLKQQQYMVIHRQQFWCWKLKLSCIMATTQDSAPNKDQPSAFSALE